MRCTKKLHEAFTQNPGSKRILYVKDDRPPPRAGRHLAHPVSERRRVAAPPGPGAGPQLTPPSGPARGRTTAQSVQQRVT